MPALRLALRAISLLCLLVVAPLAPSLSLAQDDATALPPPPREPRAPQVRGVDPELAQVPLSREQRREARRVEREARRIEHERGRQAELARRAERLSGPVDFDDTLVPLYVGELVGMAAGFTAGGLLGLAVCRSERGWLSDQSCADGGFVSGLLGAGLGSPIGQSIALAIWAGHRALPGEPTIALGSLGVTFAGAALAGGLTHVGEPILGSVLGGLVVAVFSPLLSAALYEASRPADAAERLPQLHLRLHPVVEASSERLVLGVGGSL